MKKRKGSGWWLRVELALETGRTSVSPSLSWSVASPVRLPFPLFSLLVAGQHALQSLAQTLAGASLCGSANYWLELSAAHTCLSGVLHDTYVCVDALGPQP